MKSLKKFMYAVICAGLLIASLGVQPAYAAGMVVDSNADTVVNDSACTLREAITNANNDDQSGSTDCAAGSGADVITFAANYTITLGSQLPAITSQVTITGNGAANTIIQANAAPNVATYRVFEVTSAGNLTLDSLTVRHGNCNGSCATDTKVGGGIYNKGALAVTNSILSGNNAGSSGGGIFNEGTLSITNSTFSDNTGSGIANTGTLSITNSTFSGNSDGISGGIDNEGTLTLTNSTFSDNIGYGIYNKGTLNYSNTIIANSTGGDCVNGGGGTIGVNVNNLVEDGSCSPALSGDPNLAALANNGGATPTHALLTGSIAIGAGNATVCASAPVNNLDQRGVTRPQGSVCDIGAYEKLAGPFPTFQDVPTNYWAWQWVESIYAAGITGGCGTSPLIYCPTSSVTRAQMAVFILRGMYGGSYTPPPVGGSTGFNDVDISHWAAAWIKQLKAEGITGGCDSQNYCPDAPVTRAQMAVFLLRAKYNSAYSPPPVGGSTGFTDVSVDHWAAAWIKQLYAESITGGCGVGIYCPDSPASRDQMAVFLQKTFSLPLP